MANVYVYTQYMCLISIYARQITAKYSLCRKRDAKSLNQVHSLKVILRIFQAIKLNYIPT